MFNQILLATDGSDHALRAARCAALFARNSSDACITVINVFHPPALFESPRKQHEQAELESVVQRQNQALCAAGRVIDDEGVAYRTRRLTGHPAEQVIQAAEEIEADLIVLGSRGLGDVGSVLLGSVSDAVLHHASCPVLIVRGEGNEDTEQPFPRILLASDGSDGALKAAEAAATLTGRFDARLTILNVFQPALYADPYGVMAYNALQADISEQLQDEAISSATRIADDLGISSQCRKEVGPAAAEIVQVAEEEETALLVLGSRGLSGVKSLLLGSVSDRVAHHAPCPVLIVK